jgi:hypothetical protein
MFQNYADRDAMPQFIKDITASAATAAVATKAADAKQFWCVDWVTWSYSAAPTGGKITIAINGVTVWEQDITAAGPGQFDFSKAPLYTGTLNQALTITLASGAGAVVGKVCARIR